MGHNTVVDVYRDRRGTLWVGTLDGTLQRLEGSRFVRYPAAREAFGTNIQALGEDHEGNLWIGTETRGAFRLSDALITTITAASEALHVPPSASPVGGNEDAKVPPAIGTAVLAPETGTFRVLIAEDNPDLRRYIRDILADDYATEAVEDGEAALVAARRHPPDAIVSDIVMPRRDGFRLARALRADPELAGIPLVFLTARAGDADRIAGLAIGADQYLKKPFRSEVLKAHVAAAIRTCLRLRDQLARQAATEAAPALQEAASGAGTEAQSALVARRRGDNADDQPISLPDHVRHWIEANAHDETLTVEALAAAFNMSRATLHRKLVAHAGETPVDLIRTVRLARARRLLRQAAGNVSEVAYAVGFNSLSAFSRAYRTHYGEPPSQGMQPS